jgi:hypothetical protein
MKVSKKFIDSLTINNKNNKNNSNNSDNSNNSMNNSTHL